MSRHTHILGSGQLGRRSFLKAGCAAAAATGTLAVARGAHAAGSDVLKVALIGCGGRGTGAAVQALSTQGPVKLWAMADLFADKLETSLASITKGQAKSYDRQASGDMSDRVDVPPERRFVGFDAYKQAIDSGIDVAILTTAPHFRPIHFEYAIQKGKHAFMEKPVAVDAAGVRQVLAAAKMAKEKNLKVGVGLQRHHDPLYEEIVKRIQDGALGKLIHLKAYWCGGGYRVRASREAGMSEMTYQLRNPYYYTWISGDQICEQHVHNLDVCNWIKGAPPVAARGMGGRQVRVGPQFGDLFDHHFVEFTYADGTQMFSQCHHLPSCWSSVAEYAVGTKAAATVNKGLIEGEGAWRYEGAKVNPYQIEHDRLFDAIRNNKPHNEAEYGATSSMTGVLGRMAIHAGKELKWDDAIQSKVALVPDRYAFDGTPPVLPEKDGLYPCAIPGASKVL